MILVTVGTQLPFDRLIAAMDCIALELAEPVIAQAGRGKYVPANMRWQRSYEPAAFEALLAEARVIVAHAGIGSVFSARRHKKPIILFARSAALGEHRNEHQNSSVARLHGRRGIYMAESEVDLRRLLTSATLVSGEVEEAVGRAQLLGRIAGFISESTSRERPGNDQNHHD